MSIHDYAPVASGGELSTVMVCGRCGNVVADMVKHDTHHDLLDSIAAAAGLTRDGARKLTTAQLNERLRSPQSALADLTDQPPAETPTLMPVTLSCSCGRAAVQTIATWNERHGWAIPWYFLGPDHNTTPHQRVAAFLNPDGREVGRAYPRPS